MKYAQLGTFIKFFFMVKPSIIFYLIQCHGNAFHDELSFCLFHLTKGVLFPGLVKNHSQISVLVCLLSVAYKKGMYLEEKQLVKNFQQAR